jgi:hypothetical protein
MYISYSDSVQVLLLPSNNGSVLSEINQKKKKKIKTAVIIQLYFCFTLLRKKSTTFDEYAARV